MLLASGIFKLACAPLSGWIRRIVPRAGLLGSLTAIALVLISFLPLAGHRGTAGGGLCRVGFDAGDVDGALAISAAISRRAWGRLVVGCLVYYGMHLVGLGPGLGGGEGDARRWRLRAVLPLPVEDWLDWFAQSGREAVSYLPVAIPLALATVVGGIDCTESAAAAGDDYPTGQIIAAEGLATLVGGIIRRSDPVDAVHRPPRLQGDGSAVGLYAGDGDLRRGRGDLRIFRLDLLLHSQGGDLPDPDLHRPGDHRSVVSRHSGAALSGGRPGVRARAGVPGGADVESAHARSSSRSRRCNLQTQHWIQTVTVLAGGGGFIVTSLLWATALAHLIDGRVRPVVATLLLAAVFSWFGIIHSPLPSSPIMSPAAVIAAARSRGRAEAAAQQTPYHWSAAYALMAVALLALSRFGTRPAHVAIETLSQICTCAGMQVDELGLLVVRL